MKLFVTILIACFSVVAVGQALTLQQPHHRSVTISSGTAHAMHMDAAMEESELMSESDVDVAPLSCVMSMADSLRTLCRTTITVDRHRPLYQSDLPLYIAVRSILV